MSGGAGVPQSSELQNLQRLTGEAYQDYQRRWEPVKDYFIQSVHNTEPKRVAAEGLASTDTAQRAASANAGLAMEEGKRGVATGSGASIANLADTGNAAATAGGLAETNASNQVQQHWLKGMEGIVGLGMAKRRKALATADAAARLGQSSANFQEQQNEEDHQGKLGLTSQFAGLGLSTGLT